ncbi:uncharacterized protein TM35_000371350 [Trypanosoma theileri]|uniref:Uncharacterized protein n=1 Tax=Trypanosoma theileri TaxID=67003 RepID=A0A1X0NK75_9TRYP|nr:uncharacterized protein TM35_000371350 [Trypanosoma theileri]ORC85162.1 hypothetical protein TM35_000371350 [Trypanosoma theileri]
MMEYLGDASPGEVATAYQQLFPRPVNPGLFYQDAWNNFVQWLDSIRNEGISAQLVQMGRQIYTQLRVIQTAKDFPGVKMYDIREVMAQPLQKDDPYIQAAFKLRKKTSAPPPGKAKCFRCRRTGHNSSTRSVRLQREVFKPKKKKKTIHGPGNNEYWGFGASRICTKGTPSRLDTSTQQCGTLSIKRRNGDATYYNRKRTETQDTTASTARNLSIVTSPSGNDIKERVYVNSSALSRSARRGVGIRG